MKKENCTKGPVVPDDHIRFDEGKRLSKPRPKYATITLAPNDQLVASVYGETAEETEANATLIAEAFNVLHETGMTPRELVRALRRLYGASGCIDGMLDGDRDKQEAWEDEVSELDRARAEANLILTHQPVTT